MADETSHAEGSLTRRVFAAVEKVKQVPIHRMLSSAKQKAEREEGELPFQEPPATKPGGEAPVPAYEHEHEPSTEENGEDGTSPAQEDGHKFSRPGKISTDETNRLSRLKEISQQGLDVALLSSDAATLRLALDASNLDHRGLLITLLSLSIAITLTISSMLLVCMLISVEKTKEDDEGLQNEHRRIKQLFEQRQDETVNVNHKILTVIASFLAIISVALNAFIAVFGSRKA